MEKKTKTYKKEKASEILGWIGIICSFFPFASRLSTLFTVIGISLTHEKRNRNINLVGAIIGLISAIGTTAYNVNQGKDVSTEYGMLYSTAILFIVTIILYAVYIVKESKKVE